MLIAAIPRLALLHKSNFGIESDEAIVGLMAKHINEGAEVPIFYYGQNYLGSLEALLVSGSFELFGISNQSLKLVPFLISLVFVAVTYFLAKDYTTRYGARVASLLAAVAPQFLTLWSVKARGGFIELVLIGSLSLLVANRVIWKTTTFKLCLLGLLLGLGWWVNNQIIFYAVAIYALASLVLLYREGFWPVVGATVMCGLFFVVGSLPFWYENVTSTPRFGSFKTLFGGTAEAIEESSAENPGFKGRVSEFYSEVFLEHFDGLTTEALPILLGGRRAWSVVDFLPNSSLVAIGLYLVALTFYVFRWLRLRVARSNDTEDDSYVPPFSLPLLFILSVGLIFCLSQFGWLSQSPRYLLPIYSVLFIVVGVAAAEIRRYLGIISSSVFVGAFILLNLASNYVNSTDSLRDGIVYQVHLPGEPMVYEGERVSRSHDELYEWLEKHDYNHIITNYWIGYRVAFETREQVTFSRFDQPGTIRIPEYERARGVREEDVYVLVPAQSVKVKSELAARGFTFRETEVGGYVILDWVVPRSERGEPIELRVEQLSTSGNIEDLPALIDGDSGTRWKYGGPQNSEMDLEILFEEPVLISGIDMDLGFWAHDIASQLVIDLEDPQGKWCSNFDSRGMDIFSESRQVWEFFFRPQLVKRIRLRQLGSHPVNDWSIAELIPYAGDKRQFSKKVLADASEGENSQSVKEN